MDNINEDTFVPLTTKENAISVLVGVALLAGVIVSYKLVKRGLKLMKTDEQLWTEEPIITPDTDK